VWCRWSFLDGWSGSVHHRGSGVPLWRDLISCHLIPDKPLKTVHMNFQSNCGILNVAAAC
jgi:hypothetical protein